MESGAERVPVRPSRRDALWIAFLALAYFLAQELALLLLGPSKGVAPVWPAAGISLAALLLSPRRRWPTILLMLFLAGFAAELLSGWPPAAGLGFMTANAAESLACAWVLTGWCGTPVRFDRVKEVFGLMVCATGVNAFTALLGAGTAALSTGAPFWSSWQTWWVADGLGILLVTPLITAWAGSEDWLGELRAHRALESLLFMAVWGAAGWLAFQPVATFHPLALNPYMLVGLLAWPALRLGGRTVTLALVLLAILAVTSKAVSAGPLLGGGADPLERLLAAQVCLAFIAATGLLLTSSCAETQWAWRTSREEHARLRALGDNLPLGMVFQVVRERDGWLRFLYVSAGVEPVTGMPADEVMRHPEALRALIVDEDLPAVAAAMERSAADMKMSEIVCRIRRRDGELRWVRASLTPRPLPDGRILWDGILMDITAQKREEMAREESEGRLRTVVENAEMPVVITAMDDGTVLFINESAARYFDVPCAEAPGLQAPDFWHDPVARDSFITGLSGTGKVQGLEFESRARSGHARWASISANVIDYGGRRAAFVVLNDISAIKEAAARLEQERGVLNAIFQTAPDMIWVKDAEGRYVTCNSATVRFFARPASEIIGKVDEEIFTPEISQVIRAEDRAAIAAGGPRVDQAWVPIPCENRQVLLETTKTPMTDGEGRLTGILCIARDITTAHKVQEALRERVALQEQLETVAAVAPGALFSCLQRRDGTACLKYASPAFEEIHGTRPEDYAADAAPYWRELLHPADLEGVSRTFLEAARTSSLLRQEYRIRNPRKGETWVEVRAVPVLQPDGATLWHGFLMDISERKLAEAALAEEVTRRRILFERANDGIAIIDLGGKLQESNPAFARMLGYSPEEMRHLYVWDWDARWTRAELLSMLANRFAVPATFETRHRRKDGSVYEVEVSAGGVELGGRGFIYCVLRDTTGRKAAEEALRTSRRLEGIGILAGGMAHEFNNLLTVINGYSAMLSSSFDIHNPMREQADAIRGAGERAAALTQQLLAYGRKQMIRPKALDLNLIVERSRRAWMPLLGPHINLKVELSASPGLVLVDADRMREILVNLVKNAVDALPSGGELTISTANVRIGEEYAAQHADAYAGSSVMLSVADNGVGMDEETLAHVFEPFFTTKGRATTTGLGLAMVHGSVAQHGGWITVDSTLGKGSVFKIYLPPVNDGADPDRSAVREAGKPDRRATILVVDDEDAVRQLTAAILRADGFHTLEAADGGRAKAIVELNSEAIDLILTDVILPGTTGPELVEDLRARMPSAKVIYTSGYPASATPGQGLSPGDSAFIQKPYAPEHLIARVREILAES